MRDWLVGIFGEANATAALWTIILIVIAIVLLVFVRVNRRFTAGTFISGSRGKQPRLAVTDATPVDNHRRLVLVRRDDVEHLILIGGPSDIVVEANIGKELPARIEPVAPQRQSEPAPRAMPEPEMPRPETRQSPETRQRAVPEQGREEPELQETTPEPAPAEPRREVEPPAPEPEPSIQIAERTPTLSEQAPQRRSIPRPIPVRPAPLPVPPNHDHRTLPSATAPEPARLAGMATPPRAAAPERVATDVRPAEPDERYVERTHIASAPRAAMPTTRNDPPVETRSDEAARRDQIEEPVSEHTLEDEMSKLLEELSEQKH
ncbi:flagellar biosynthetic protein FliO [uncultured Nitratireductor sp.]|uniref:flagellar biosynthetic protein FliO n=1 Tax=uncultured Nitratireductor sp. TaxID=520953 RepID=UPI00262B7B51|nr:flagellar biosynthetic protein FliO [uncultured Nitratireductor sp.]